MAVHDMCADIAALLNPMPAPIDDGEPEDESFAYAAEDAWREREEMAEGLRMSGPRRTLTPCCPPSPP